jgi:tripartite-type tricarboxylate transporter receptor subunit TctC
MIQRVIVVCAAIGALAPACAAFGQTYPEKPIRIIVPYAPSGGTDVVIRGLAPRLIETLGQQIVVENRPGANGIIGSELIARAPPDGYSLLMTTNALTVNPWLYKVPFNAVTDLAPISTTATACSLLAVHPSLPARSVKELIDLARARPGQMVMAASGAGQPSHLSGELLKQSAKIDFLIVQYRGTGASLTDLAGGHIMFTFSSVPGLMPLVQAGKLRALGTSCKERVPALQTYGIPAVAETLPGFEVVTWYALMAPAKTPAAVIQRLHGDLAKALARDDVRQFLDQRGFAPGGLPPAELAQVIREELGRWEKIVKTARIRAD